MAVISNEWYQQRERERQRERARQQVEAPVPGSVVVDSTSAASPARLSVLTKIELPAWAAVESVGSEAGELADEPRTVQVALARVTASQAAALRAIVEGRSVAQAAEEAGVTRRTLYRWRTKDGEFIAALNAWRAEVVASARDRLLALAERAVNAVAGGLDKGDARLGLRVLQDLRCSQAAAAGPENPDHLLPYAGRSRPMPLPREAVTRLMGRLSREQITRLDQILQLGIDADNARIAPAGGLAGGVGGEPVEARKQTPGATSDGDKELPKMV